MKFIRRINVDATLYKRHMLLGLRSGSLGVGDSLSTNAKDIFFMPGSNIPILLNQLNK